MNKWPDGTPKSQNNAFTVSKAPSKMSKDKSAIHSKNANAKKSPTQKSPTHVFLMGSK